MTAARHHRPEEFPATQWSLVARAGQADPEVKREALGQLLGRYLPALQAHLVHQKRIPPEKADDLVQQFAVDKILEKDLLAWADRQLGKLRTFLLTALNRFVKNQFRDQHAKKRSPGDGAMVAFDERQCGVPAGQEPSRAFDVAWARGVVAEALRQMRAQCENSDRMQIWDVFECRVVGPILEGAQPLGYAQLVKRFGFHSPSQASNVLTTAKRMYARALREAVGKYARDELEIETEIAELKQILTQSGT